MVTHVPWWLSGELCLENRLCGNDLLATLAIIFQYTGHCVLTILFFPTWYVFAGGVVVPGLFMFSKILGTFLVLIQCIYGNGVVLTIYIFQLLVHWFTDLQRLQCFLSVQSFSLNSQALVHLSRQPSMRRSCNILSCIVPNLYSRT